MKMGISLKKNCIKWISMLMSLMLFWMVIIPPVSSIAAVNAYQLAHYTNTGLLDLYDWMEEAPKCPGEDIVVAVIDTGLYSKAASCFEHIWYNEAERDGEEGVDDDGNGYVDDICGVNLVTTDPMKDSDGHGTQVAGIIGMHVADSDARGIAYGAKVMPIRVGTDRNFDEDLVIEAIEYAVNNGADVINMSFATYKYSEKLENAVRKASQKCVMVAAAGNEGYVTKGSLSAADLTEEGKATVKCFDAYPASWDCCIGVMSYGNDDQLASFSCWDQSSVENRKYDIIAPGENIYTLTNGGKLINVAGTSFSTAYVSAAVAIYMGLTGQKNPAAVKEGFLSRMNRNCFFRQAGYTFVYPRLSFDVLKKLTVSANTADDPNVSENSGGQSGGEDLNNQNTNTTKQGGANTGGQDVGGVSGGTGKDGGQSQSTVTPPEGIRCPEAGGEATIPVKTKIDTFKKPAIKNVKQTAKKLTITIKNLPKTGKTTLRVYKNNKVLYKATVKKSKMVIKKKKLVKKGKIKLVLSYKKGKTTTKATKTIKLK